jgi:hypothetical protein
LDKLIEPAYSHSRYAMNMALNRHSDSASTAARRCALGWPRLTVCLLIAAILAQGVASPPIARAWLPETFEQGEGPADSRELPIEEVLAGFSSPSTPRFSSSALHRSGLLPRAASCRRGPHYRVIGLQFAELDGRNGIGAPLRC